MYQKILFDLDGTLTDPKEGICKSVQYALEAFGIKEEDIDKLTPFIGPPLKNSFMEFYGMTGEEAEEAVEKYRERFSVTGLYENKVYAGIPEMLGHLREKGYCMAIASSKPTVFVNRILQHFSLDCYFDVVVGSELNGKRVNKDEVIKESVRELFREEAVCYSQVVMVGDRKFDVEGAKVFGMDCIGVDYGYAQNNELAEAGAAYVVSDVGKLEQLLLSLYDGGVTV